MASTTPIDPSSSAHLSNALNACRISLGCWMGLFMWDFIASFPQESRYVWKSKWTPLKTFWLLNRYTTMIAAITYGVLILGKFPQGEFPNSHYSSSPYIVNIDDLTSAFPSGLCSKIYWLQPVLGTLTITFCAVIAAIRVHAIFNRDRRILFLLITSLFASLTVTIVMLTQTDPLVTPQVAKVRFAGCMATQNDQKTFIISWIAPLCFDSLILFLVIFRSCSLRRKAGSSGSPTGLRKIVNKHILYFAVIAIVNGLNVGFYAFADPALKSINVPATIALTSIMSSRLVLSLYSDSSKSPSSSCASSQAGTGSRRPSSGVGSAFNSVQSSDLVRPTPSRAGSQESHHHNPGSSFSNSENEKEPSKFEMSEKPPLKSHKKTPSSVIIPMSTSHTKKPSSLSSSDSSTSRRSYEHIIVPITLDPLHLHSAIPPSSSALRPLLLSSTIKPPSLHSNHSTTSLPPHPVSNPQARPNPTRSQSLAVTMIPEIEPSTPLTFSASFFNSETSSFSSGQEEEEEMIEEGDIGARDTGMMGRGGFSDDSSSSEEEEGSERTGRDSMEERESLRRAYLAARGQVGSREEFESTRGGGGSERATIQVVCE
ncbi:hypothetical protein JCM5353_007554 [Sporobolomyces roseus]